jgi:hypothetical protein
MINYGMFKKRGKLFMRGGGRDRSRFYRPTNTMLEVWVCLTPARRNEPPVGAIEYFSGLEEISLNMTGR